MKKYIERSKIFPNGVFFVNENNPLASLDELIERIWSIPAADVVSKGAYDQVAWERDVAIRQLREDYGVGLGEKKAADVVERKRGEWVQIGYDKLMDRITCSCCNEYFSTIDNCTEQFNFCPNCGADMRQN